MKKFIPLMFVAVLAFSFSGCNACEENILTKLGDSIATMGKDDMEKNKVLATRKASRAAKCAEQKGAEMKKKMGL